MRIVLLAALLGAAPASADLMMNYNGFYARMKKLQEPEYSDITLAFALTTAQSGVACKPYSIKLVSAEHDLPVDIAGNGELSLPYDEALKNSNAVLTVLQADNAEPCQVQFRLRSRMRLAKTLTADTLQHYRSQFDLLLDDMAGLGKYWLPDVKGVIAEFAEDVQLPQLSDAQRAVTLCQQNRCHIILDDSVSEQDSWPFSQRPLYLLPLIDASADQ